MLKILRTNSFPGGNELLQIISDCRAGDPEACRSLYDLFFSTILNNILAVYRHFSDEEIEDIVQDTYYQIFTSGISKYDPARANPHTFFGIIARNTTKKYLSRRKFTQELCPEDIIDDSPLDDTYPYFPEDSHLDQILNDLEEQEKELIQLRFRNGLILEDIAVIYNVNISTIHHRLKKILKNIRSTQKRRFLG